MKLFYGSFSALENSFSETIQTERSSPLAKWLVVCSSSLIAQQLKKRLARERGILANVHFITGAALLGRLDQETGGAQLPLFPQDNLRDFLIKDILSEPGMNPGRYPVSDGFAAAVKNSLRDLADALVAPDIFLEYAQTSDTVPEQERSHFLWVARLYQRYVEREKEMKNFRPYQSAFENALEQVENSAYLKSFERIIWYGFYDMSARQLDFFNRIRQLYPVTVFVPYQPLAAYGFAEKFFTENWLAVPGVTAVAVDETAGALGKKAEDLFLFDNPVGEKDISSQDDTQKRVKIISAGDVQGELFYTAKEILRLVEEEGYSFGDMAVVARTTEPYQQELRRYFAENKIPLDASFTYPFTHYGIGRFCFNLFSLLEKGVSRESVLSVLSSPYFKNAHKNKWCSLIRKSSVNRDLSQWEALLPSVKDYDAKLLEWLKNWCAFLNDLAEPQPWESGAAKAVDFLRQQTDPVSFEEKDSEIFETVCQTLQKMEYYAQIRPNSRQGELLQEIKWALENLQFHEAETIRGGVLFTDIVRMRGVQPKVVFVLGLNEKLFPLSAAKDPILLDTYRYQLRNPQSFSYLLSRSTDRAAEEKLLFFFAVTAAQQKLYALYSRKNAEGKDIVPSGYVAELARILNVDLPDEKSSVQSEGVFFQKENWREQTGAFSASFLTPKELSYAFMLSPKTARENYEKAGLLTEDKKDSLAAALHLSDVGALNAFDGQIGPQTEFFARENEKGFSPSSLEELSKCPIRYFFDKGLYLGSAEDPFAREALSHLFAGQLVHDVLRDFYLTNSGQLSDLFDSGLADKLNQIMDRYFAADRYREFGLYPLVWEVETNRLRKALTDFVIADVKNLNGFVPSRFEEDITVPPSGPLPFCLKGRIDRIDVEGNRFFVTDYKITVPKRVMSSRQITLTLRQHILADRFFQPFLYVYMLEQCPEFRDYVPAGSALLIISDGYKKYELKAADFENLKERAYAHFTQITDFIKDGTFFIIPGQRQCAYCPFNTICRKDSFKSVLRVKRSPVYQALQGGLTNEGRS